MILTITPNPCVDKTVYVGGIELSTLNRAGRYSRVAGGKGCNVSKAVKTMGGRYPDSGRGRWTSWSGMRALIAFRCGSSRRRGRCARRSYDRFFERRSSTTVG